MCMHLSPKCEADANCSKSCLTYKHVISFYVCDIYNSSCMLHHCDDCSKETDVKFFLKEHLLQHYAPDHNIKFRQWVRTDRSQLEDKEEFFDDFLEKLSETLSRICIRIIAKQT